MGTVMALKSDRLGPTDCSTSIGTVPESWSMTEGGRDCSMGCVLLPMAALLGMLKEGGGLLRTLLKVRLTGGGGEVMLNMSGDMGVL